MKTFQWDGRKYEFYSSLDLNLRVLEQCGLTKISFSASATIIVLRISAQRMI